MLALIRASLFASVAVAQSRFLLNGDVQPDACTGLEPITGYNLSIGYDCGPFYDYRPGRVHGAVLDVVCPLQSTGRIIPSSYCTAYDLRIQRNGETVCIDCTIQECAATTGTSCCSSDTTTTASPSASNGTTTSAASNNTTTSSYCQCTDQADWITTAGHNCATGFTSTADCETYREEADANGVLPASACCICGGGTCVNSKKTTTSPPASNKTTPSPTTTSPPASTGPCWEADKLDYGCIGYPPLGINYGYTCVGNECAAVSPESGDHGQPESCANFKGICSVDTATGRCKNCSGNKTTTSPDVQPDACTDLEPVTGYNLSTGYDCGPFYDYRPGRVQGAVLAVVCPAQHGRTIPCKTRGNRYDLRIRQNGETVCIDCVIEECAATTGTSCCSSNTTTTTSPTTTSPPASNKTTTSPATPSPPDPKTPGFKRIGGTGWCTDAAGNQSTARRLVDDGGRTWFSFSLCASDPKCVAVSHSTSYDDPSIMYTSTGCTFDCSNVAWLNNPGLIVRTSEGTSGQPPEPLPGSMAAAYKCYIKHTASAPSAPTKVSGGSGGMSGGLVALTAILVCASVAGIVAFGVYWFRFRPRSRFGSAQLNLVSNPYQPFEG